MATNIGTLLVTVTSSTKPLVTGMNLALVAVGAFVAASVKAAVEYDQAFTRIGAISNASAAEVAKWKDQVMSLSGETAQAPQELADALFFLASAGLDANQIMPALEASAKASAVGLGETADIAKITANALNAYAGSGLTAAQVTDTLVAAVREGSAEPEEFAQALGRILPIASAAGVSFDEVTASLAALSNIGLDVNEGTTAMRGLLQALVAPGNQAADALAEVGLSTEKLRSVIADKGVLVALAMLEKRTDGNIDTMRAIVPNIRALTGALGLTVQEAKKVSAIFDAVKDSSGSLEEAFGETQRSNAFKLAKAFNDIKIAGMQAAQDALPQLVGIFGTLSKVAVVAAHNIEALGAAFIALKVASAAGLAAFGPAGLIALGVGGTVALFAEGAKASADFSAQVDDAGVKAKALGLNVEQATAKMARAPAGFRVLDDGVQVFGGSIQQVNGYLDAQGQALRDAQAKAMMYAGGIQGLGSSQQSAAAATRSHNDALREQQALLLKLAGGFLGVIGSANSLKDAQAELTRLQEHGKQGTEAYRNATVGVLQASVDLKNALASYGQELVHEGKSQDDVIATLKRLGNQYGLQKGDIRGVINEVSDLIGKYGDVPDKVTTKVNAQDNATSTVVSLEDRLNQLTAHDWEIRIHAKEVPGSPIPSVLIQNLWNALQQLTKPQWEIKVHAVGENIIKEMAKDAKVFDRALEHVGKVIEDVRSKLEEARNAEERNDEKIASLIKRLDSLKDKQRDIKEMGAAFDHVSERVQNLIDRAQEFADTIKGAFDIDLTGGLLDILTDPEATQTPAQFLEDQVKQAQEFASALEQLQQQGLSAQNLADLASKGVAALPLAQALLASPELIAQLNAAQQAISDVAENTMNHLVDDVFGDALEEAAFRTNNVSEAMKDLYKAIGQLLGNNKGGGHNGNGNGNGPPSPDVTVPPKPDEPPIEIHLNGDVAAIVDRIDEALGKRGRTQGRLVHKH